MDFWTVGPAIATMATGLSALAASTVWLRGQWRTWQAQRAARRLRDWQLGYVHVGMLASFNVRSVDAPNKPTAQVVLEVLDGPDGNPSISRAHELRQWVQADGMLARVPSPAERDFLNALQKVRQKGGFPVR